MTGTIEFGDLEDMAVFLDAFQKTGNTSVFVVREDRGRSVWVLEFTGGY